MRNKKNIMCLIVLLFFYGCTPTNTPPLLATVVPIERTITPELSETPSITPVVTVEEPSESQISVSTSTSTAEVGSLFEKQCPTLLQEIPNELVIQGELLLKPNEIGENPYFLSFDKDSQTFLPYSDQYFLEEFSISPNRQFVAYFANPQVEITSDDLIIIADAKGGIIFEQIVNRQENWYLIDTWLNNETLLLERYQVSTESMVLDTPLPVSVLNPFSGSSEDLIYEFPDLTPFLEPNASWDFFGKSGTAFDPTLNFAAYARLSSEDFRESIVLWNLQTGKEIVSIQAAEEFGNGPAWSPSGLNFVVDSLARIPEAPRGLDYKKIPEELFNITREGEITRLTNFADLFQDVSIGGYVWSPDGSQVAFWLFAGSPLTETLDPVEDSGTRLAIFDFQNNNTTVFCLEGVEYLQPIWAPNGNQVIVGAVNSEKSNASGALIFDTLLIDMSQNIMIKIADEAIPLGWMIDP